MKELRRSSKWTPQKQALVPVHACSVSRFPVWKSKEECKQLSCKALLECHEEGFTRMCEANKRKQAENDSE